MTDSTQRRHLLTLGGAGLALAAAGATLDPGRAAAQAAPTSLLRTVLDRGKLIVGTGSTNPPWHFEDDKGQLTGMDIAMARILSKGLFDDETKVEYVRQEANARIPNITSGKVDVVIQFMTVSPARAQLVAFSRPYYVEGAALLTSPKSKYKTYAELKAAGKAVRALQSSERPLRFIHRFQFFLLPALMLLLLEVLLPDARSAPAVTRGTGYFTWLRLRRKRPPFATADEPRGRQS